MTSNQSTTRNEALTATIAAELSGTRDATPVFTAGDDEIHGSSATDLINGGPGNDTIIAGDEIDFINAGSGDDLVLAGEGNDVVIGDNFATGFSVDPTTGEVTLDFSDSVVNDLSKAQVFNPDGTEAVLYRKNSAYGVKGNSESGDNGQIGYSFVENDPAGDRAGASEVLSISVDEHSYAAQVTIDRLYANEGRIEDAGKTQINEVGVWTLLRDGVVVQHGYFSAHSFDQATLDAYGLDPATDNLKVLEGGNGYSNGTFTIDPTETGFVAFDEIQFSAAIGHYSNSRGGLDSSDFLVKEVKTLELGSDSTVSNKDFLLGENGDDVLLGVDDNDFLFGDNQYDFNIATEVDLASARVFNPNDPSATLSRKNDTVGVSGNEETGSSEQLGFSFDSATEEGQSESITYSFGEPQGAARLTVDRLYSNEASNGANEVGKWTVYSDGVQVASGYFTSTDIDPNTLSEHGLSLADNIKVLQGTDNKSGHFDITLQDTHGLSFDTLELSAAEGVYNFDSSGALDSSDYFIKEIKTIDFDSTLATQEGDDWLDGGKGDDFLIGGYGKDVVIGGSGDDVLYGDYAPATALTQGKAEALDESVAMNPDGSLGKLVTSGGSYGILGNDESGVSKQIGYSFEDNGAVGDVQGLSETLCVFVDQHTVAADISVDRLFKDEAFDGTNEVGFWKVLDQGVEVARGYFTVGEFDANTLATFGINPEVDNVKILENGNGVSNGSLSISPADIGTATFDEIQLSAAPGVFDITASTASADSSDFLVESVVTYQNDDLLVGGLGDDILDGGWGLDVVSGGEGNDTIYDNGNDFIDGGEGFDVVITANSPHAVELELTSDSKIQNVEALVGSHQVDSLLLDIDSVAENTDELFVADIEALEYSSANFSFSGSEVVDVATADFNDTVMSYLTDTSTDQVHKYSFDNEDGSSVSVYSNVAFDNVDLV
ncbi:hypothetical protein BIY21_13895 [Vibrio ponticus]|uniref:Uncharacterized protein n=1 Tax=Vibrio ponticus TaxID=265668 RepID=A0ABX3FDM2_9VIBR|nr:hypothetical protein [Vibrio ponticus]OLQ90064.1 hypothetical protein BIY21_13895 [Vibrio ponticus]